MSKPLALVLVLRRDPDDLSDLEYQALLAAFPQGYRLQRTDPADYIEHAANCARLKPAAVILPLDKPIPSLAMEHGYPHVALTPSGLMELLPLHPQFKEFKQKASLEPVV